MSSRPIVIQMGITNEFGLERHQVVLNITMEGNYLTRSQSSPVLKENDDFK